MLPVTSNKTVKLKAVKFEKYKKKQSFLIDISELSLTGENS